ncbi:TPA: hypothetical protein O9N87_004491, partial [Escherichia coli]|nr:hypothetical protein [Escherichia coli]
PSESPIDLKFNSGKVDEFVTSPLQEYTDRFGNKHYTIEGINQLAKQAIQSLGFVTLDSFQEGATLTSLDQALRWKLPDGDGNYYRWDGAYPKDVPARSTPASSGGIGKGKWLSIGDGSAQQIISFEGIKHGQKGLFTEGVTLFTSTDVVQDAVTGWYYSYLGSFPHTISSGESLDANWKALGNLNGYSYNNYLNWKNDSVTPEQALSAAFNTKKFVDLGGAEVITTSNFTIPANSPGIRNGILTLGGNLSTVPYDYIDAVQAMTESVRAGVTVVKLDGIDRTGQYIRLDNGLTYCIDNALASGVAPDSVDGVALTQYMNDYKSQFVQVTKVIGHTADGYAIIAEPTVVNLTAGTAKWSYFTGNITPFRFEHMTVRPSGAVKRMLWLAQIDPVIEHCDISDMTFEAHYGCYNLKFLNNKYTVKGKSAAVYNEVARLSFGIQSHVAEFAFNKISTTGTGDADLIIYKQCSNVNVHDNIINAPVVGNTWYTGDHWSVCFHSTVYHCRADNNITSSVCGIGSFVLNDDIQIANNTMQVNVINSSFSHRVVYSNNHIIMESSGTFIGNQTLQFIDNTIEIREGRALWGITLAAGAKPFGAAGFKTVQADTLEVTGGRIYSPVKQPYLNPKPLMGVPGTTTDDVFPTNNAHLANQTVGIQARDVQLRKLKVKDVSFDKLNYGISIYKANSGLGITTVDISGNNYNTDAGVCLRGQSGFQQFNGSWTSETFGSNCLFGIINANIQGLMCTNSRFLGVSTSAVLVASATLTHMQFVLSSTCTYEGTAGSGFK